jgi:anti-sigma B factor antagonist
MTKHREGRRSRSRPIVPPHRSRHARRRVAASYAPVRVSVEQRATVALLHVSGDFDLAAVDRVEAALDRAIDPLTDAVVFDLRGVSFLDLSGLRTLVRADARARRQSFAMGVVPPPGPAARIFTLTEAGRDLALLDDLPDER